MLIDVYYLPALTIQPIVENAITHGCCIHPQGTFIQIDMWYEENQLILSIHDNGAGMDPQILLHLQERLNDVDKQIETGGESGIGLVNIQSRIQHRFGQDYLWRSAGTSGVYLSGSDSRP